MAHQFFFNPYILDGLPTPATGFDVVQDISEPMLRLYVTSRGAKTFFVRKRVHGVDKRIIIGSYPEMDIETARSMVATVLHDATKKIPMRRKQITFREFWGEYLKNKVRRSEDSEVKLVRAVNQHLPDLFDKNLDEITQFDVKTVIEKIRGAAIAARMQEVLTSIFKYGIEQGYIKTNPVIGLPRLAITHRKSPLNDDNFPRLLEAIRNQENETMRNAFLMLIYSFLPKSKVLAMRWDELDFNRYTLHDWPLPDVAVVLLEQMPQDSDWVFVGRCKNHLMDPRTAWNNVVAAARIPGLRMDDVYKFFMRKLVWASDREDLRANMNNLLEKYLAQ